MKRKDKKTGEAAYRAPCYPPPPWLSIFFIIHPLSFASALRNVSGETPREKRPADRTNSQSFQGEAGEVKSTGWSGRGVLCETAISTD